MPETVLSVAWPPSAWPRARRRCWFALIAGVIGMHLAAIDEVAVDRFGWGGHDRPRARIEVAFVRELAQSAPPATQPQRSRRPIAAVAAAPAASRAVELRAVDQAVPTAAEGQPAPELPPRMADDEPAVLADAASTSGAASAPLTAADAASAAVAGAAAPVAGTEPASRAAVPAPSASAAAVEWPPSTRLRFRLEGWYRGRFEGSATVDWLRNGQHYQVHLQTSLGPLMSRRLTSDGELTDQGLAPRRFDGEQRVLFRGSKRWAQSFARDRVTLADGSEVDALPGTQDEASQFVQLTWLFTTQPGLLQVGRAVTVPLALNRRVERWVYDVIGEELLYLPFGSVPTYHLKPRREAGGGDLTPQIWIAPTLQYLPVRIRLSQDAETYVDLQLESPPLQAER